LCVHRVPFGKKGNRIIELATSKFYELRDIVFHETIFPFVVSAKDRVTSLILNPIQNIDVVDDDIDQAVRHDIVNDSVRPIPVEVTQPPRRSTRQHKPSSYLNDYVYYSST